MLVLWNLGLSLMGADAGAVGFHAEFKGRFQPPSRAVWEVQQCPL